MYALGPGLLGVIFVRTDCLYYPMLLCCMLCHIFIFHLSMMKTNVKLLTDQHLPRPLGRLWTPHLTEKTSVRFYTPNWIHRYSEMAGVLSGEDGPDYVLGFRYQKWAPSFNMPKFDALRP